MKHTILVADDEKHILKLVQIPLQGMGYDIILASNGNEAWDKMQEHIPSLVISDVMMPGKNGFELLELARENPKTRTIPFILLTARSTIQDKLKGFESGADDYLTKPFHIQELIARVRTILQRVEAVTQIKTDQENGGFYGNLQQVSLPTLLQMLDMGWKTGVITLRQDSETGYIYISEGQVVHAIYRNLQGENAVYRMLKWRTGNFTFEEGPIEAEFTIHDKQQALVMEGMRQLDEISNILNSYELDQKVIKINEEKLYGMDIPDNFQKVLMMIDGEASVAELSEKCPFNELELFQGLQYLLQNEVLEIKAA